MRRRLPVIVLLAVIVGLVAAPGVEADEDQAYREHDADNVSRSSARQTGQLTSPEYHEAMRSATAESWMEAQGNQLADLERGRLHTGLGQIIPGGAVGDPEQYNAVPSRRIQFLSRTGAKLSGRIWGSEAPGPRPGIVITTGSIQGTEHMYWWAARRLVGAGYTVMTWDVQGQGESEGFGHEPGDTTPTGDGFPSQQAPNFVDGTVDALRFFLSTPERPYSPQGWTPDDVAAAQAGTDGDEQIDWSNPGYAALHGDPSARPGRRRPAPVRLGLAGHSLGASAVSVVQQCSDEGELWRTVAACHGQSFPIKAIVAWDSLNEGVEPVVPAMDQQADGYFLNPTPSSRPPDPTAHLDAFETWRDAGVDTYTYTVRGGTHLEWSEIPFILPATEYGTDQAAFYTLAWFDRYVSPDRADHHRGTAELLEGPLPEGVETELPWKANYFSARYLGAFDFAGPTGARHRAVDLRAYAGLSPVGDWAGANADRQGRVIP